MQGDSPKRSGLFVGIIVLIAVCGGLSIVALVFMGMVGMFGIAIPLPHTIIYRVTGTASQVDVSYDDLQGSTHQETVSLPWEQQYSIWGDYKTRLDIVNNGAGDITCEIEVDGVRVMQQMGETRAWCSVEHKGNGGSAQSGGTMR